eukprot:gb/GECG01011345.1/.p1 GENE.gb/GECG01011345.1/~~gb/GECG01011345.1/.p1  ORF type:complete len:119 (+),score=18.34 gb/GECG01011345.1/:1-357(+)
MPPKKSSSKQQRRDSTDKSKEAAQQETTEEEEVKEEPTTGRSTFRFVDGSTYEGDWIEQNGIKYRHGEGTFTHPSGEKYEGSWEWDVMTGHGKFHSVTGSYYEVRDTCSVFLVTGQFG